MDDQSNREGRKGAGNTEWQTLVGHQGKKHNRQHHHANQWHTRDAIVHQRQKGDQRQGYRCQTPQKAGSWHKPPNLIAKGRQHQLDHANHQQHHQTHMPSETHRGLGLA